MFRKYFTKSNLTIPNVISFARILLIIPFIILFINRLYIMALICLVVSGISDFLDGIIARKLNQISELGIILDPIADKLTLFSVMFCLCFRYPVILPFCLLLTIKELLLIVGTLNMIKHSVSIISAKWYGKLSTFVFYISTLIIASLDIFKNYRNYNLTIALMCITVICMLFSLFNYIKLYSKLIKSKKSSN